MDRERLWYVYYSYEQWGRGYIGIRKCDPKLTPETDPYWGTYFNKSYNPTEKIILFSNLAKLEALNIEVYLHKYYDVENNKHFANLKNQNEKFHNDYCSGKKWVKNELKEKYINLNDELPCGYNYGRLTKLQREKNRLINIKNKQSNLGKSLYNNGINHRYFLPNADIPQGWTKGLLKELQQKHSRENHPCHGKRHYNNGIEERFFFPDMEIPEGYIIGRLPEVIKKSSGMNRGKIICNNGIKHKYILPGDTIPSGFIPGVMTETKQKQSKSKKGKRHSKESRKKMSKSKKGKNNPNYNKPAINRIRVITFSCCYFSVKDACEGLRISKYKFNKLFEKDPMTGFYVEIRYIREKD